MKKILISVPVILILALFFVSCEKEISVENGGVFTPVGSVGTSTGTAIYTFDGGTGNCTGALVNGTYTTGVALVATNAVIITVNVDSIGTYSITTNTLNGISFRAVGTFTTTGIQTITFEGTGTPTAAGSFNFTPGTNGCTYSVTVGNGSVTTTADYYFDITVNGERIVKHIENTASGYTIGNGSYGSDDLTYGSIISPAVDPIPLGKYYFEVTKGLLIGGTTVSDDDFKNFFSVGSYSYAATGSSIGAGIVYIDSSGKTWQSDFAPGTQTGSSFSITSSEGRFNEFGEYIVIFKAEFNCTLYDDAGNSITVTNGKFSGEFKKII